jgi:hypothetical protein
MFTFKPASGGKQRRPFNHPPTGAAQFTSANSEYLSIPSNASLLTGDIDFSVAGWFYRDSAVFHALAAKQDGGEPGNHEWQLNMQAGTASMDFYATVDHFVQSTSTFGTGEWIFAVGYHDAANNEIGISVNNEPFDTLSIPNNVITSGSASVRIGAVNNPAGAFFNGRAAAFGFWKRVLTQSDVTALYNGGCGREYFGLSPALRTSLISYWNLNEVSGIRADSHGSNNLTDNNSVTNAAPPC